MTTLRIALLLVWLASAAVVIVSIARAGRQPGSRFDYDG
jgi:hypothetical protein